MSCGTCSEKTKAGAAAATGAPVATGAAVALRHCPTCGGFLPKSGECRNPRCRQLAVTAQPKATARTTSAVPVMGMASLGPSLDDFIASNKRGSIPPGIAERWEERVVANSWHVMGEPGAEAYLKKYGKGIGADKVKAIARYAEDQGYKVIARGFWKRAYELEHGAPPPTPPPAAPVARPAPAPVAPAPISIRGLDDYINNQRRIASRDMTPIPSGIAECWDARIVPAGWHLTGERGAEAYLKKFGKGVGADEMKALARYAEDQGGVGIARGFWKKAYEMEHGAPPPAAPTPAPTPSPAPTLASVVEPGEEPYDAGRINGRQFRKTADGFGRPYDGATYTVAGRTYTVNDTSGDPKDFSVARDGVLAPKPKGGVVKVGRFFERAAGVLAEGRAVEAPDGTIEVYDKDHNLVSAYDPKTRATADINGDQRGSPEQFAAIMAHALKVDKNDYDGFGPAFRSDLDDFEANVAVGSEGSAQRVADGFYLLVKGGLMTEGPIVMGGKLKATHCPTCGAWMGNAGCQNPKCASAAPVVVSPAPTRLATPIAEPPPHTAPKPGPSRCPECHRIVSTDGLRGHKPGCKAASAAVPSAAAPEPMKPTRLATPIEPVSSVPSKKPTGQEYILNAVRLPAPDPYRSAVPARLGGKLTEPVDLDDFIPAVDDAFEINDDTEKALRTISTALQTGDPQFRNFFLSGKPGTGKNTILRQVAASVKTVDAEGNVRQGIPYYNWDITEDSNVDDLIGGTVIRDGNTYWNPGPLAAALMSGSSVVVLNEIVRKPKAATLLQAMMEDREIQVKTPDGGSVRIPISDGCIIAMTGNPGYDRDPDRPGAAAFTRCISIKVESGSKEERKSRMEARYARRIGAVVKPSRSKAEAEADIFKRDYTIKTDPLQDQEANAVLTFMDELEAMIDSRAIQARTGGGAPLAPGPRGLDRFTAIGKGAGDWRLAQEMIKCYCTQATEQFKEEWELVQTIFDRDFLLDADGAWIGEPQRR